MFIVNKISNKNPLLNHIHIFSDTVSCKICPNLGASIQELSFNNIEIIDGIDFSKDKTESYKDAYQSAILFPFVGRIPNGKYIYKNILYKLETNELNRSNALHGLIYDKQFKIDKYSISTSQANIELSYISDGTLKGFPFEFKFQVNYIISNNGVTINLNVTNLGSNSFPFGCGWHPYFKTNDLASSLLSFTSKEKLVCNKNLIPTGIISNKESSTFAINNKSFDDTFILLENEMNFKTNNYDMQISFDENLNGYLQLYIPQHRKNIAIEPVTCVPNAFNTEKGLLELSPKEQFNWSIELKIETHA